MYGAALPTTANVCAVIVTFNPETSRLKQILATLTGTVACTVIVDDGSSALQEEALRASFPALVLKRLADNKGIAAGQNQGIALARALGYAYVLLLDQDSLPESGMVAALIGAMARLQSEGCKIGCVGPRNRSRHDGAVNQFTRLGRWRVVVQPCRDETSVVEVDFLISSGSLIPMAAFDDVGGLEEPLFIDQVDSEWCLRARAKGWRIFGACDAILEHRLGEAYGYLWLGRLRRQPRHKAFRYYYIFRNTIIVCRRDYIPPEFKIFNFKWLTLLFLMFGVFTLERNGELRMMLKGMLHGLRGITGKLQPH